METLYLHGNFTNCFHNNMGMFWTLNCDMSKKTLFLDVFCRYVHNVDMYGINE